MNHLLSRRRAGVLLHPTSLPHTEKEGCFGQSARGWIDFLQDGGFTVWQVLPLVPTDAVGSPYHSCSVFAGNPMMVGLQDLLHWGLVDEESYHTQTRTTLLTQAASHFEQQAPEEIKNTFKEFCAQCDYWLEDYLLFHTIHEHFALPWYQWPENFRDRDANTLHGFLKHNQLTLQRHRLTQFLFWHQWMSLKKYANDRNVWLFGDMPIFAAHDSVDVWRWRENFYLDAAGAMSRIAAVPPDSFADAGQLWNMPHYHWQQHQESDYRWWRERLNYQIQLFDLVRIDHFRGFEAAFGVPSGAQDAKNGQWYPGPGIDFFKAIGEDQVISRLVAEDLGYITQEVNQLRESLDIPGMRVLQFAFDNDGMNPHLPQHHRANMVVYTGTHDNNTTLGWWQEAEGSLKERAKEYLCGDCTLMPDSLISAALASVAHLVILPLQDMLQLGSEARMNRPGSIEGNWQWQVNAADLNADRVKKYRSLLTRYARL